MDDESFESDENDIQVKRFSVKFQPPTLLTEYTRGGKKHLLTVRFKSLNGSPHSVTEKLVQKYPTILSPDLVCHDQLRELVELVLSGGSSEPKKSQSTSTGKATPIEDSPKIDLLEKDLNKVSDAENSKAKALMSVEFEKKRLMPGDEGYEYDKRADFVPEESNEWDEDEDEDG